MESKFCYKLILLIFLILIIIQKIYIINTSRLIKSYKIDLYDYENIMEYEGTVHTLIYWDIID